MTGKPSFVRRLDWVGLLIPAVIGGFVILFYSSVKDAPEIDRVFVTPLAIAGAMVLLVVLWGELRAAWQPASATPDDEPEAPSEASNPWRVVGFIALMVLYLLGMAHVGFFVSSFLMIVAGMLCLGVRDIRQLIVISTALIGTEYVLFAQILDIPFPASALGLF